MSTGTNNWPWFAIHIRGRYEKSTAAILHDKGYEWLLPLYKCRRRWSDRSKELELPLFPGYLFCRFDLNDRLPILTTPGVLQIVGIGKTPIPVDESEVEAIQSFINSGLRAQPWPFLQIGQRVRIDQGPLSGLEGIVIGGKPHHRLIISVTLLQRSVAVDIETQWIYPILPNGHAQKATAPALLKAAYQNHLPARGRTQLDMI